MPFTEKFFHIDQGDEKEFVNLSALQALYGNTKPIYIKDWLDKQKPEVLTAINDKKDYLSYIIEFKKSDIYRQSFNQINTLLDTIYNWAANNGIDNNIAENLIDLKESLHGQRYLPNNDIPEWFSTVKQNLEIIYSSLESEKISQSKKTQIIKNLSRDIQSSCAPGVASRIKDAKNEFFPNWPQLFQNARLKIVQTCAENYLQTLTNKRAISSVDRGMEIHYVNAFRNLIADTVNIPSQEDSFAEPLVSKLKPHVEEFQRQVEKAMKPSTVAAQLVNGLLTPFDKGFSPIGNYGENQAIYDKVEQLNKQLDALGLDPFLKSGIFYAIYKDNDDVNDILPVPYPEDTIAFTLQCSIIRRFINEGYLPEDTIKSITVDDDYQLVILPNDMTASWVQSPTQETPPEPIENFLNRKPEYRDHPEFQNYFKSFFNQQFELSKKHGSFKSALSEIPEHLRLSFLTYIKNNSSNSSFLEQIDKVQNLTTLLPKQDYIPFLKLVGAVSVFLNHLPYKENRFVFLTENLSEVLSLVDNSEKFYRLLYCLNDLKDPKKYMVFLALPEIKDKLAKFVKDETSLESDYLIVSLMELEENKRLSFLTEALTKKDFIYFHNFLDFSKIINCFEETSDREKFINLLDENKLKNIIKNPQQLEEILNHIDEANRLTFIKTNWELYKNIVSNLDSKNFIRFIKELPSNNQIELFKSIDSDKLNRLFSNYSDLEIILNSLNEPKSRIEFLNLIKPNRLKLLIKEYSNLENILNLLSEQDRLSFIKTNWGEFNSIYNLISKSSSNYYNYKNLLTIIELLGKNDRMEFIKLINFQQLDTIINDNNLFFKCNGNFQKIKEFLALLPDKEHESFLKRNLENSNGFLDKLINSQPSESKKIDLITLSIGPADNQFNIFTFIHEEILKNLVNYSFTTFISILDNLPQKKDRFSFIQKTWGKNIALKKDEHDYHRLIEYSDNLEAIITKLLPEDRINFLKLITESDLKQIIKTPNKREKTGYTSINYSTAGFINLQNILTHLPKKDRFSFIEKILGTDQDSPLGNLSENNFISLINLFKPNERINFLNLINRKTLNDFINPDLLLNVLNTFPTADKIKFFNLIDKNTLTGLIKNDADLLLKTLEKLPETDLFIFLKDNIDNSILNKSICNKKLLFENILEKLPSGDLIKFLDLISKDIINNLIQNSFDDILSKITSKLSTPEQLSFFEKIINQNNIENIIKKVESKYEQKDFQAFLHSDPIHSIISNDSNKLPIYHHSLVQRAKIEAAIQELSVKANSLPNNTEKKQATLDVVDKLMKRTKEYFTSKNLCDPSCTEAYLTDFKGIIEQKDVRDENHRMSIYRPVVGLGQLPNQILAWVTTILSFGVPAIFSPSLRNTLRGKTDTQAIADNAFEVAGEVSKNIQANNQAIIKPSSK